MKPRKNRYFVGDFETTVYEGQEHTEVWASASVELFTEEVHIFHSIGEQFEYFLSLNSNIVCYYHNLKFDGAFWLSYLLIDLGFEQAIVEGKTIDENHWLKNKDMKNKSVSYSISNMGQWYRITIKINNKIIELRDSLKLLPFSVKRIGESFATKHKKLDMEYKGFRYAGCHITDEEKQYIGNDVMVIKEALEIMFTGGHKKLTIGSCCLAEYKALLGHKTYTAYFPNLCDFKIPKSAYGAENADEYIRYAYHGGWCYCARGKENKVYKGGVTLDVNSLYPSVMSSESNNRYPIGYPTFWKGNLIPKEALNENNFFFIRIRTRFKIKPNKLPFIQIKSTLLYKATEMLETSDVYSRKDGKYHSKVINDAGEVYTPKVTLTLTMMDYDLLKAHYNLYETEILDGCYFNSAIGIFDSYINKYKEIKLKSTGAQRELAKLFLNNLYGKMASSTNSSFKVAYIKDDKSIGFYTVTANDKAVGYIPVGAAITSYARNFTIKAAQMNYYGKDNRGFIYADTDSIHCDLTPDEIRGVEIHDKDFCKWKIEGEWDNGLFVRQKTYIEHIVKINGKELEKPHYIVKCAGMPERCKQLFLASMGESEAPDKLNLEEQEFLLEKRRLEDFKIGLIVPGKLLPRRIHGGVVLKDTTYEMR